MGLDMYLEGRKYLWKDGDKTPSEDGFRLREKLLELGYWRKHPDLHGYIVQEFADGKDDCNPIYLTTKALKQIITAIEEDKLPHTEGFFFGESVNDEAEKKEAIALITKAIEWSEAEEKCVSRNVQYRASW